MDMLGRKKDRLVGPGRRRSWAIQRLTIKSWLVSYVYPQFGYIACFASCQRYTPTRVVQYPWHYNDYLMSIVNYSTYILFPSQFPIGCMYWYHDAERKIGILDKAFLPKNVYFHKSSIYKGFGKPWNVLH